MTAAALVLLAAPAGLVAAGVENDDDPQSLVDAVERQDWGVVRELLAEQEPAATHERVDVNATHPDGATALHWAVHWNDVETAALLAAAGADVNAVNELGVAPLHLAALNASQTAADVLLRWGADPNRAGPSGETALMTAGRTGNPDLVRALLEFGATVDSNGHFQGQSALMWAAAEGQADAAQMLITHGADVDARSVYGATPLLLAARNGDVETARVLLEAGADVNAAEPILAFDGRVDVEESQTSGRSPLFVASASLDAVSGWEYRLQVTPSTHEALAIFLLENGANSNLPDSIGRTPLHVAVDTGKANLVKELLASGADPNARLTEAPFIFKGDFVAYNRFVGATPLWMAAAARVPSVDILRDLADAGADPGAAADDGTTPLMAAVGMVRNEARLAPETDAFALVRFLVAQDINVNAVDSRGRTAMHGAARLARNTLIPVLVERGGEVNIADARGQRPLDVGTVSRPLHPDTAALLRSYGATSAAERQASR